MEVQISEKPLEGWNEFLLSQPTGTFFQSTHYAEYAEKEAGLTPIYLRALNAQKTVGQLVTFKGSRFHGLLANMPFHRITTPIVRKIIPSYNWVYAPVTENELAAKALLDKLYEISNGKANGSIHPLATYSNESLEVKFKIKSWATFIIDLSKSEDELWKAVDNSARKNVRKTLEEVIVKQVEIEEEYKQYHAVLNEGRKREKVFPYRYSPSLWEIWRKTKTGEVFLAVKNGKVLAGLGISCFNGYVNEWGAATSTKALKEKVYAQDAIKWTIIKWAKEKQFKYFDLTGINPNPQTEKEKGIYRYKEKWGGKLVSYNTFS